MKKTLFFVFVIGMIFLATTLAQDTQIDPMKNFSIVDKPGPIPEKMQVGADTIKGKDLKSYLAFLSSDLLEGRETATRGYDLAAEYAASLFSVWGIRPAGDFQRMPQNMRIFPTPEAKKEPERTYFQDVPMKEIGEGKSRIVLQVTRQEASLTQEFFDNIDFTYRSASSGSVRAPVVFAGYGISEKEIGYDDYKKINAKGKWILLLAEAPGKNDPQSPFQKNPKLKEKYFPPPMFMRGGGAFNKVSLAESLGAVGVLLVRNPQNMDNEFANRLLDSQRVSDESAIIPRNDKRMVLYSPDRRMPWETLPTVSISPEMANRILAANNIKIDELASRIEKSMKPASFELAGTSLELFTEQATSLVRSRNIIGFIEGSDPKLKEEVIVIGGHLDHLGTRGDYIFNGADDNGSGSVAVMALARAFAMNPQKPKRSIVFALWTGEEKGLLGSRYYVEHPFIPLEKTIANLTIDMLSRPSDQKMTERMSRMMGLDPKNEILKKIRYDRFLSINYSSDIAYLSPAIIEANQYCGYDLYLRETSLTGASGGSDHASFGQKKIPWLFVLSSMGDDYHKPSDSIEKINVDYMEKMNRLLYLIAYLLADK